MRKREDLYGIYREVREIREVWEECKRRGWGYTRGAIEAKARRGKWRERLAAEEAERRRVEAEAEAEYIRKRVVSKERVLEMVGEIVGASMGDIITIDERGMPRLRDGEETLRRWGHVIKEIGVEIGRGGEVRRRVIRLHDKVQAMRLGGEYLKLWGRGIDDGRGVAQNNFLLFLQIVQSGKLDRVIEEVGKGGGMRDAHLTAPSPEVVGAVCGDEVGGGEGSVGEA